jgi:hypothetical protein
MLKPGLAIASALALSTAGCASGTQAQRLERVGNASLTGVIVPPTSAVRQGSTSCAGVRVQVTHASEPTRPLGSLMVKQSRERCLYVLSSLPSDAELRLEVSPARDWRCAEGQSPTLQPRPGALRLRDYETATRDFRATCE